MFILIFHAQFALKTSHQSGSKRLQHNQTYQYKHDHFYFLFEAMTKGEGFRIISMGCSNTLWEWTVFFVFNRIPLNADYHAVNEYKNILSTSQVV